MPDKQNDNKILAMLERRGIVRKADSENEPPEDDASAEPSRPEADIRTLFGSPTGDTMKVTPAARQPVPGISNPILSGEQQQNTQREQPKHMESRVVDIPRVEQPRPAEAQRTQQPRPVDSPVQESQRIIESVRPESFSEDYDSFAEGSLRPSFPAKSDEFEAPEYRQQPSADDYTDRFLEIEELYDVLSVKSKRTDTIYLVEEYLKSLPDSLPDESRREIVSKIVVASGFDYDLLMGDGVLRVKMLKDYAERFAHYTDEYVAARQEELEALDQQIQRINKLIESRKDLHKKQFFAIEAEAQRLKDILSFISG